MVLIFLIYLEDTITSSHSLSLFLGFMIFIMLGISQLIPKVQLSWLTLEFRRMCLMLEIGNVQGTHLLEQHDGACLGPATAIVYL